MGVHIVITEGFEEAWENAASRFEEDDVKAIRIVDRMGSLSVCKEGDEIVVKAGMIEVIIKEAEDILLSIEENADGVKFAAFGCYIGSDIASAIIKICAPTHVYLEREECIEVLWKSECAANPEVC